MRSTLIGLCLLAAAPAFGVTIMSNDVCPPAADSVPCILDTDLNLSGPAAILLDFGNRPFVMKRRQITADTTVIIRAGSVTLEPGARIAAPAWGVELLARTGDVLIQASGNTLARIDVSATLVDDDGGDVSIRAFRNVGIQGRILSSGDSGGSIDLTADTGNISVELEGSVEAVGNGEGDGGWLDFAAGADVTLAPKAQIRLRGSDFGGELDVSAGDDVDFQGEVDADGGGDSVERST